MIYKVPTCRGLCDKRRFILSFVLNTLYKWGWNEWKRFLSVLELICAASVALTDHTQTIVWREVRAESRAGSEGQIKQRGQGGERGPGAYWGPASQHRLLTLNLDWSSLAPARTHCSLFYSALFSGHPSPRTPPVHHTTCVRRGGQSLCGWLCEIITCFVLLLNSFVLWWCVLKSNIWFKIKFAVKSWIISVNPQHFRPTS